MSAPQTAPAQTLPPAAALEDSPCPLGCTAGDHPVLRGRDRLLDMAGEFNVVRCAGCGLMRTNPRPSPAAVAAYYPEHYGPYLGTQVASQTVRPAGRFKRIYRRLVRLNTEVVPEMKPGRLLEIGCASGAFLARMATAGWQVEGLEFAASAGERARRAGFTVHIGTLEQAPIPLDAFDLVVGWMVIEHLHEPVPALRKLAAATRDGGWLCVSVPNAAALEFRLFGPSWYALQLPTHLYHYTPNTLARVLEAGGWRVERVFHQRMLNNLVGSLGNWLEDRGAPASLWRALKAFPDRSGRWSIALYPLAWLLSLFGQTGRMTVWARKA